MKELQLDVVVTRGDTVESHHHVHAAVSDASGAILARAGDPTWVTHWRSCAKPFQLMPFLESGGFDSLDWGDDQMALACASHGGEPEHVAIAERMLSDIGLEEGDLACGPRMSPSPTAAPRSCARAANAPHDCTTTARANTPPCSRALTPRAFPPTAMSAPITKSSVSVCAR